MRFPPAQPLAPLNLAGTPRASVRPLHAADLVPGVRSAAAPQTQHDRLVDQTRNWVAQTFFGTLLKQMENSPFKSDLFSGGRGGQAFGSIYHQQLAQRMADGAGSKLVNAIVRKIEASQRSESRVQKSAAAEDPHPRPRSRGRTRYKSPPNASTFDRVS